MILWCDMCFHMYTTSIFTTTLHVSCPVDTVSVQYSQDMLIFSMITQTSAKVQCNFKDGRFILVLTICAKFRQFKVEQENRVKILTWRFSSYIFSINAHLSHGNVFACYAWNKFACLHIYMHRKDVCANRHSVGWKQHFSN